MAIIVIYASIPSKNQNDINMKNLLKICLPTNSFKYLYSTQIILMPTIHWMALSNISKYCYVRAIIQFFRSVKRFQAFSSTKNNSI